jgi:hypothetical protein
MNIVKSTSLRVNRDLGSKVMVLSLELLKHATLKTSTDKQCKQIEAGRLQSTMLPARPTETRIQTSIARHNHLHHMTNPRYSRCENKMSQHASPSEEDKLNAMNNEKNMNLKSPTIVIHSQM